MNKNKFLIVLVVLTLGSLAIFFSKNRSISVYPTKESCELETGKVCVFPVCGHIPKGANFKEVCNVDFNQGWMTASDFSLYSDRLSTDDLPSGDDSDKCGTITDEMECFRNPLCKGQYGPSSCSGGICTADEVFKKCVEKPSWEIEVELQQKRECEEKGMSWEQSHPLVMPVCR